jgi:hypothetical protein
MGKKYKKLNDFIENSDYEVHTQRTKNKNGKLTGKSLDYKSTVSDWKDQAKSDCKLNQNDLYKEPGDCEKDTLREDLPEFCLFGTRCVNQAVRKAIDKDYKNFVDVKFEDIPDEVIELMNKNLQEEDVF